MPKPNPPPGGPPPILASGDVLTEADLPGKVAAAIHAERLTLGETAERVGALPDRETTPTPSAIAQARKPDAIGKRYVTLQLDILRALTGADFTGPLYRVN